MEAFAEVLRVGGRSNSLGRTGEVVDVVRRHPDRLRELLDCAGDDDAWVRMRAVDAVEKVCREEPSRLEPYLPELLGTLTGSAQASVQWHLAQILGQVRLTPEQQALAVAWLVERVSTTEVDWIVSVHVMQTLLGYVDDGLVGAAEVAALVDVQCGHRSASVRRKAALFHDRLGSTPSG